MTRALDPEAHPAEAQRRADAQVCLVSLPYASLSRPSLALGLLAATLEREGISTATIHANLDFAAAVGVAKYQLCAQFAPKDLLLGEWTFARAAFGDETPAPSPTSQRSPASTDGSAATTALHAKPSFWSRRSCSTRRRSRFSVASALALPSG